MEKDFILYQALKKLWNMPEERIRLIKKVIRMKDAPQVIYGAIGWFNIDEPELWVSGNFTEKQIDKAFDLIEESLNVKIPTVSYEKAVLRKLIEDTTEKNSEKAKIISAIIDMCVTGEVFRETQKDIAVN